MRCGILASKSELSLGGQATTLQVIIFVTILAIFGSLLLSIFHSWTQLNLAPLIALKVARIVDEVDGVVGLKFEVNVKVTFLPNGTVVVETSRGIGKARVLNRSLIPSSAEGFVVYIMSNGTHARVTSRRE